MRFRTLGRTNLRVSEIGFGAWAIGGASYGPTDDSESKRALFAALDHGVNFIDTADSYGFGHSEELIGEVIRGRRQSVILATKVGWDFYRGGVRQNFSAEYIPFALEQSLKRLGTDYIDLYQLHNPPMEKMDECRGAARRAPTVFETLDQLKREGKIHFYGVSIHSMEEGIAAIRSGRPDTIQVPFNLMDQRALNELFPFAQKNNIGIIAREPLACGMLAEKHGRGERFPKTDHRNRWSREKIELDVARRERLKEILYAGVGLASYGIRLRNSSRQSGSVNRQKRITKDVSRNESHNRSTQDVNQIHALPLPTLALEFALAHPAVSVVIPGAKTPEQVHEHLKAVGSPHMTPDLLKKLRACWAQDPLFQDTPFKN